MVRQFISKSIGNPTDAIVIRGRENVPAGDSFAWWTCHFEYRSNLTNELFLLSDLQNKYQLGFGQRELWDLISKYYITEEVYVMNVNHPKFFKTNSYRKNFNNGNDCDSCQNQYLYGQYGDVTGCHRYDDGLECEFFEVFDSED